MPNYNHARFLPHSLGSVLSQSYRPKEIILIDDGSTDDSVEVIERFAEECPLIRFHQNERNKGILHNLALLMELATGDFVLALACDDMILPGCLEKSMAVLERYPQAGLCSSLCRDIGETGEDLGPAPGATIAARAPVYLSPEASSALLQRAGHWIYSNTSILRRQAVVEIGGFRPELFAFCDGFASLLLALKHGACFIPEYLAARRLLPTSYSQTTHTDPDRLRTMVANATALMRGQYGDLFPRGFADVWEREVLYGFARQEYHRLQAEQRKCLDRLSAMHSGTGLAQRVAFSSLSAVMRIQSAFFSACLVFGYNPKFTVRRVLAKHFAFTAPKVG
jgi:glycosyltransferase involved in cell wall biosynthesis